MIRKRYLGNGFTLQGLSEDYIYRIKRDTLNKRIRRLAKRRWLNKRKLTKEERRAINKEKSGKIYKYSFSEQSKVYLAKYGTFTNEDGILMNPLIILLKKMNRELESK